MDLRPPEPPLSDGIVALRMLREDDVPSMVSHCRDPEMQRWTLVPSPYGRNDAYAWIERSRKQWAAGESAGFAIVLEGADEYLGGIDVRSGPWPVGEIGYGVRREVRGRGVATRALRLLSRWALDELGLVRLQLVTDVENVASQRVAERAGFTREGILRQALEVKGRRSDCVMFSLLPADSG
jgi:RimJ/RimL family protein N-acetyltransferase